MNIKEFPIITPDIIDSLEINKKSINNKLSRYIKEGKFIRVKRGFYINVNLEVNLKEVSNNLFNNSYISLDTVLYEEGIIKQYNSSIYSITNKTKSDEIIIGNYKLYNYKIDINSELGLYIDKSGIRRATKERALLDSLYLKIFSSNYPGDSEINMVNIDRELISKLLSLYPQRVQSYYLKIINE